jgi:group I intron endonuclease
MIFIVERGKDMKQSGIYKITINDKVYVGLSVDIVKRIICHKSLLRNNRHSNNHLQSAYNKYKSFDWEVLEEDKEWIEEKEIMWIDKLDAYKNGFNQNDGGAGNNHTEESKRKISAAMSGKNNPMYGKDWRVGKTKEEMARISAIRAEISRNHPVKQSTIEKLRILNTAEKNPAWTGVSTEDMIDKVLEHQSVVKAAEELGINKYTIRKRLTKAGYDFVYDGHKFSIKSKITNIVRVR